MQGQNTFEYAYIVNRWILQSQGSSKHQQIRNNHFTTKQLDFPGSSHWLRISLSMVAKKTHTVGSTTTPGIKQPLSLDLHQASLLTKVPWDLVTTWPRPVTHAFHLDLNIWGQFLKEVQSQANCLSLGGSGRCCITFLSWACPQPHFWLFCLSRSSWQDKIRGANTYDCHFHSAAAQMPKPERNAD